MAGIERRAAAVWEGGLARGTGTVSGGSGAIDGLPVSWPARVESPDGKTSPEELVAAAHAVCYSMALANVLNEAGNPPERLDVDALVSAELGDAGLAVTASDLTVTARVPGMDDADFRRHAEEAERSCPVSNALRGNLEIRVHPQLAD